MAELTLRLIKEQEIENLKKQIETLKERQQLQISTIKNSNGLD